MVRTCLGGSELGVGARSQGLQVRGQSSGGQISGVRIRDSRSQSPEGSESGAMGMVRVRGGQHRAPLRHSPSHTAGHSGPWVQRESEDTWPRGSHGSGRSRAPARHTCGVGGRGEQPHWTAGRPLPWPLAPWQVSRTPSKGVREGALDHVGFVLHPHPPGPSCSLRCQGGRPPPTQPLPTHSSGAWTELDSGFLSTAQGPALAGHPT